MRAVVTGGAGFLGSHLVDRLVAAGHLVEVVDDLSTGSLAHLSGARAEAGRNGTDCRIHTLDVRATELADLIARRGADVLFHLAARRGGDDAAAVHLDGVLNVLEAARRTGVGKVVVGLDALELYGEVHELPAKEGQWGPPVTVAGAAAHASVALLAGYRAQHAVEHTALAFGHVYGPRRTSGVVAEFLARTRAGEPCVLHGDGRQTRDFVYVDDAVDALVRAATKGSGLVVNVGTGVATSIRSLHKLVVGDGGLDPVRTAARPGEPGRFALSPVRARIHLAWAPWTALAEGIDLSR